MALEFMSKAFQLNNTTPTNNNQRSSSNPCYSQIAQSGMNIDQDRHILMVDDNVGNQFRQNAVQNVGNLVAHNIAQKEEVGIQLNSEKFDFMAAAGAYDDIEKVTANCNLQDNLQQASTSGTQSDKAPVYDSDGSAEVHHSENCYDNDIFNMFTQEEQYTELLEPIPEPRQVPYNDSNVISEVSSVEQSGGIVDQHPVTVEETRAYFESLYNNLAIKVEKVNSVNRMLKENKCELTPMSLLYI
ncbi:hypothetical protein Tco_1569077 [Tanacetum coccineum]